MTTANFIRSAFARSNARAAHKFAAALVLLLGAAGAPGFAHSAVTAAPLMLSSSDGWSVNLGSLVNYDSSGDFTMPTPQQGPAPSGWNWTNLTVVNNSTTPSGIGTQTVKGLTQSEADGTTVSFYATGSTDPFLSYGFSVTNPTGSTQTYTFATAAAVSPVISGGYNLFADISGSFVNTGVSGLALQASPVNPFIQTLELSSNGGSSFTDSGADVGPGFTSGLGAGAYSYGVYSSSLSSVASSINYWQLVDQFTLTGNGDIAAFTGFAEITPNGNIVIPEPSTYAAILGAMSLGLVALRRRFAAKAQS